VGKKLENVEAQHIGFRSPRSKLRRGDTNTPTRDDVTFYTDHTDSNQHSPDSNPPLHDMENTISGFWSPNAFSKTEWIYIVLNFQTGMVNLWSEG